MAYYKVKTKNDDEFLHMLRGRDEKLVTAMVNGVLDAIDRGLDKADLVEVNFNSRRGYVVTVIEKEYETMLKSCLEDMIRYENYELCARIKKYLDELNNDL